jgi:DNA-binding GntR family transcriptional regulator
MENHEFRENYQDLCGIIQAVENGQADLARKLARNHVLRFSRYIELRATEEEKTRDEG